MNASLLIFSLILSSSLIQTDSVAMSGFQAKGADTNIPFLFGMFVLAPVLVSTWIVWTQHKKKLDYHRSILFDRNGGNKLKKMLLSSRRRRSATAQIKIYTAEEMKTATNDYSDRTVMQRCSPGTFYRGSLPDGKVVVVVKIPTVPRSEVEQFVSQLMVLSEPHANLVKLIGCCLETSFPLLVYELHGDGDVTLFDCLHDEDDSLSCKLRVKAAAGAACGLAYLQSRAAAFCHGNICSGNILLDDCFDAKLFYAVASGRLGERSDVYSFGVVLVELLMRRRGEDDTNLAAIVSLMEEDGACEGVYDEFMWSEEDGEVVREVGVMAARCLSVRAEERPSFKQLEAKLNLIVN